MRTAIIYIRVSTEDQVKGYSLEGQRERCVIKAKAMGAEEWIFFEDAGVSGSILQRPALIESLSRLKKDQSVEWFICTHPDRLSRDLGHTLAIMGEIKKVKRASVVFSDYNFEDDPNGKLMLTILGAFAEYERARTLLRTKDGKRTKALQHKWTHWPGLYGYDFEDGVVKINEQQAQIVRLVYRLGSKLGVEAICSELAKLEIASPRAAKTFWSRTTIRRMIDNATYYTGITHIQQETATGMHTNKYMVEEDDKYKRIPRPREEWIEMHVPPILTEEEFNEAHTRRDNAQRKALKNATYGYLLSGLLRCAHCGQTWHGHGGNKRYYVCTYKSPGPRKNSGIARCETNFVPCENFDSYVWEKISGFLSADENIHTFQEQAIGDASNRAVNNPLDELKEKIESLDREETSLLSLYRKETNARVRVKLEKQLEMVKTELDKLQAYIEEMEKPMQQLSATWSIDADMISLTRKIGRPDEMNERQRFEAIHNIIREIRVEKADGGYILTPYFR